MKKINFFIITPCYNEENNILKFFNEVTYNLKNYNFKFLFIDDGSTDNTWNEIRKLRKKNKKIFGIKFSRNFGKENALDAAIRSEVIENAKFVVVLDSDLQHPIPIIKEMILKWKKGHKLINTFRVDKNEGIVREIGSILFYKILNLLTDYPIKNKMTDFMLLDKKIIEEYKIFNENKNSFRAIINWMGYQNATIPIKIKKRKKGNSSFNIFKLFKFGIQIMTSYTIFPIKLIGYTGVLMSFISFCGLVYSIYRINLDYSISYQTIMILTNLFLTGIILIGLGLIGLYQSKISDNTNKRPRYVIDKKL